MRLPAGTVAQPSCAPTSSSYFCDEAQETNFQALSCFWLFFSIAHAQVYSQPDASVSFTGACAYAILPFTGESGASRLPAAEVASYHIATLPWVVAVKHSANPACAAPASPCAFTRSV